MKTLKFFLICIILFNGYSAGAQNREIKFEHGKWAEILQKSIKENKMVYLDCYAVWCGPCKWMAKNVFTNDTVADFYNSNFVNVEMDMEKGEGLELAKKFGIQAYPTMLYLNSSGEIMHRTCGSGSAQNFIDNGKAALDPNRQLASATKKFNEAKTNSLYAFSYFAMLENGCQNFETELSDYFALQKESDLISRNNWNIIYKYVNDYSSKEFLYFENNKASYAKLYSSDSVENKIVRVYSYGLNLALRKKNPEDYARLKSKIKESDFKGSEKIILISDMKLYEQNKDWSNYIITSSGYLDKFGSDNASDLNNIAWVYFENINEKPALEKAAGWAKHATELENNYGNNDTYAALLYKLGKKEGAKQAAEKAISLAKNTGEDYEETSKLLRKIEKLKSSEAH
jgi:thiol-disulfide isomerase/thioredoxin